MKIFSTLTAAILLAGGFVAPAFAQDPPPDKIVLESKVGGVMTSTGGDYQTANVGNLLVRDESMMLSDGAKATVVYYYDNGKRKCTEQYSGPNTYIIDDNCKVAAWLPHSGASAAIIIGTGVVIAAILQGQDNVPPGPISTGPNGRFRLSP